MNKDKPKKEKVKDWRKKVDELLDDYGQDRNTFWRFTIYEEGAGWLDEETEDFIKIIDESIAEAKTEAKIEVLEEVLGDWDNDNVGDFPNYGSAGASMMKSEIRGYLRKMLNNLKKKKK